MGVEISTGRRGSELVSPDTVSNGKAIREEGAGVAAPHVTDSASVDVTDARKGIREDLVFLKVPLYLRFP